MTISTEVRKAGPFIGNGSASVFPFAFKVFKAADLIVVRRQDNIGEETTLVLDSDYHVTLNSNQDTTPGGVVTLVAGALASGFTLVVSSELPYLQPTDLTNQGGFYPKVITNALDRLTIFCQQLAEITGRTLKLPITAPTNISAEIPLPNPSELIAWNETGTGLTTVSPQSLVTSIAYGSATADLFAGDGVTTTFPLSTNPASVNNLDVSVGGFSQRPVQDGIGDYSWNGGATITFVEPPPAPTVPGDKNVLVRYMQAIPISDSEALHAQTREALRRSYADAGYNLVDGSFETGGTLTAATDVLLQESTGAAYGWTGALPKVVAPGTDPSSGGFVSRGGTGSAKRCRNLSWFGAVEGENSTSAILAAAASGFDIVVDVNTKIVDQSIALTNGQRWVGGGGSIRQECVLTNPVPANTSVYGASAFPLFKLASAGACVDGVSMQPAFEAAQMSASSKFINNKCDGEGRSWYDGVTAFAWNCTVNDNEILNFGQWLPGITYASRGEGIFFSNSATYISGCEAQRNKIQGCAKNGIFIIGAKVVRVHGNHIVGNRMSAIQIAFLSHLGSNNASGLSITGNTAEYNGADSFDCNNSSGNPLVDTNVNAIVAHNIFRSNGWIYPTRAEQLSRTGTKQETPDGGACTLVNVGRVMYINNDVYDNARSCAYLSGVSQCVISGNRYYKETSGTGDDTDGFRIVNSTNCTIDGNIARVPKVAYRIEGACAGTVITKNNTFTTVSGSDAVVTPNGLTVAEFSGNYVEIVNGKWFTNGILVPKDCEFVATVSGSTTFYGMTDAKFNGNKFKFPQGALQFDSMTRLDIRGLQVVSSTASINGAVRVSSPSGICHFRDLDIVQSGTTAAMILDGGSFTAYFRDGRIAHTASGNNLRVNNGVAGMIIRTDGVDLSTGFLDFTGATRQQLTWA